MYPNLKAGLPEKNWKDPEKFKKRNELKLVEISIGYRENKGETHFNIG